MLTIGLSTLLFLAFAGLGNLLLIMNETAYMLVPLYAVWQAVLSRGKL